jgi:hypothetical protein
MHRHGLAAARRPRARIEERWSHAALAGLVSRDVMTARMRSVHRFAEACLPRPNVTPRHGLPRATGRHRDSRTVQLQRQSDQKVFSEDSSIQIARLMVPNLPRSVPYALDPAPWDAQGGRPAICLPPLDRATGDGSCFPASCFRQNAAASGPRHRQRTAPINWDATSVASRLGLRRGFGIFSPPAPRGFFVGPGHHLRRRGSVTIDGRHQCRPSSSQIRRGERSPREVSRSNPRNCHRQASPIWVGSNAAQTPVGAEASGPSRAAPSEPLHERRPHYGSGLALL